MDQLITTVVILLMPFAMPTVTASSSRRNYGLIMIDCGALNQSNATGAFYLKWQPDDEFIKTGENRHLAINHTRMQLNTLRFFPIGLKNCYHLSFLESDIYSKFMVRAEFYYGNYDGLSNPPSFQLEIDGKLWANVTTSMSQEVVYYELIYIIQKQDVSVCLLRTSNDHVPFISSLEAFPLFNEAYIGANNNTAMYLHARINYGANRSVEESIDFTAESLNRIWQSEDLSNYSNIHDEVIPNINVLGGTRPPWQVIGYAIQAKNLTDSIYLSVNFWPRTAVQGYFLLYFKDPILRSSRNQTCRVEIYIDNIKMGVADVPRAVSYPDEEYRLVSLYPVAVIGWANVTISAAEGSTLPPLLNAMEVFSALDVSDQSGCSVSLSALFIISFHFLAVLLTQQPF